MSARRIDTLVVAGGADMDERRRRRRAGASRAAAGRRRTSGHLGLLRRVPAGGSRPAGRTQSHHALGRMRAAATPPPGGHGGPRRDLRTRRQRLVLGRRHGRHRPGARADRRRSRPAGRRDGGAPARRLPPTHRRSGTVLRAARRPDRRHRTDARPAVLAPRPSHRRSVDPRVGRPGQPLRAAVQPGLQDRGRHHPGRPCRSTPASKPPAACWKAPTDRSSSSPRPAASAHPKP